MTVFRSPSLTIALVLIATGILGVTMHHLQLGNGPRFLLLVTIFIGFQFLKKNQPLRKVVATGSAVTIPDDCPHCHAPVVGWKRRWFRDNTYHCEACGGDSQPSLSDQHSYFDGLVVYFAWAFLNAELKSAGFSLTLRLTVGLPLLMIAYFAFTSRQPLRKIIPDKPAPLPDPNPCECPSCGITLKRGRTDCHWCGWKPDAQPLRES